MPINKQHYIVFDLETGGKYAEKGHEAISVAGKAFDARTLEPFPVEEGGEFYSLMKPLNFSKLEDEALNVNKITREELEKAPDQGQVWREFIAWVGKYNINKGLAGGAPLCVGKNVIDFDFKFVEVLNKLHSPKKEKTVLFYRRAFDIDIDLFLWLESQKEPTDLRMDTLRPYFGLSSENGHNAMVDVKQTAEIFFRFLKLRRRLQSDYGGKKLVLKGALKPKAG